MGLLITLIILLVLAIVFFIAYPIFKRKIVLKKYNNFCSRKIEKIAKKNGLNFLTNLNLYSFDNKRIEIDHILFGKKYIYILSNFCFDGSIKGVLENNSWILEKRHNQGSQYIDNINNNLLEKSRGFSEKINANLELIVPIAIVNNDTEINVDGINNSSAFIVHYSALRKMVKNFEQKNVSKLDEEEMQNLYENLRKENEQK